MEDVGLLGVGGDLRLGVGDDQCLSCGVVGLLGVGDVGLHGVEGVGVPEGEASLPCLLRLHPLQPGPRSQNLIIGLYRIIGLYQFIG